MSHTWWELFWLNQADRYANQHANCCKVKVGAIIINRALQIRKRRYMFSGIFSGANRTFPESCCDVGCLRKSLYGNDDKTHRGPTDCRAIHAEIDAICRSTQSLKGATIFVTRYPCEACARAIAAAGIKKVVYGRQQTISDMTQAIFDCANITVTHIPTWDAPDAEN